MQNSVLKFPEKEFHTETLGENARPFVKWVGGKRSILNELTSRMPTNFNGYNECFLGGGALFFATQGKNSKLSDINLHLILTYRAIKHNVNEVIRNLEVHSEKHNKTYFLKCREKIFNEESPEKIAALFIYLNKTCFNGLYRVNRTGKFNVPIGSYKNPKILDRENLYAASAALQDVDIVHMPFIHLEPQQHDFYYMDPPYHKTYDGYNGSSFGDDLHVQLFNKCREIDEAGGYFMVSNSDTDFVRSLYKEFNIEEVMAGRYVSCKGDQRGRKREFLIRNYD